ncbi:MAG: SHOCT domain-containing protein [Janthinobacterium lividum]
MRQISPFAQQAVDDVARRHGFGVDATLAMLDAVIAGNGTQAQFSHREFSGSGQWMRGGMTMVSDMFNSQLKSRVDALCADLSDLVVGQPDLFRGTGPQTSLSHDWWPSDLRWPDSTGTQNGTRYACFSQARRLVIEVGGTVTVYDTLEHRIGGFSQQQSRGGTLSFDSQTGPVDVAGLRVVSVSGAAPRAPMDPPAPPLPAAHPQESRTPPNTQDVFATIERLADLRSKGILSDEEFTSKKTELLSRV